MNLKDEDGAIIIEATLSLSFFVFYCDCVDNCKYLLCAIQDVHSGK